MDEADRQRLLETLRNDEQFRAAVRRELFTEELLSVPHTVAALSATMREDVGALVETTRDLLQASTAGFDDIGREIAQHQADTAAGFMASGARFDQLEADIAQLRDERST